MTERPKQGTNLRLNKVPRFSKRRIAAVYICRLNYFIPGITLGPRIQQAPSASRFLVLQTRINERSATLPSRVITFPQGGATRRFPLPAQHSTGLRHALEKVLEQLLVHGIPPLPQGIASAPEGYRTSLSVIGLRPSSERQT